jgi:sodium bicarbonate transporter 10
MFLLKEGYEESPALFTEMGELIRSGDKEEWKETARWVKFEEDVEEGGNRWSKPHVATLSLHALFQLRLGSFDLFL